MRSQARLAAAVGLMAIASGCATSPSPRPAAPAASGAASLDASYDWRVLMSAPFGSVLKDSPAPLHEVLQFDDQAQPGAADQNKDCYTTDAPPRFLKHHLGTYLLCFDHDKLQRIEAAVLLQPDDAPRVLSDACRSWLHTDAGAQTRNSCGGVEGAVRFSAQLQPAADAATLTVTLTPAVLPAVGSEAAH